MRVRSRPLSLAFKAVLVAFVVYGVADAFTGPDDGVPPLRYFTIQSSILLGLVTLYLMARELRGDGAPSRLTSVLRGCTLLAGSVTGIVFHVLLASQLPVIDFPSQVLHTLVPIGFLLDWLVFERKGGFRYRDILLWLIYPLTYLFANLLAARFDGFYPYGFMDASQLGYGGVAINTVALVAAFSLLAALYVKDDRVLARAGRVARAGAPTTGEVAE
jgi:hypothetical protein